MSARDRVVPSVGTLRYGTILISWFPGIMDPPLDTSSNDFLHGTGSVPKFKSRVFSAQSNSWADEMELELGSASQKGPMIRSSRVKQVVGQAEPVHNFKIKGKGWKKIQKGSNGNSSQNQPIVGTPRKKKAGASGYVKMWPQDKIYLTSDKTLSEEFKNHFRGHCIRCGMNSHGANSCKSYEGGRSSLCQCCRQGLHKKCKNPRFKRSASTQKDNRRKEIEIIKKEIIVFKEQTTDILDSVRKENLVFREQVLDVLDTQMKVFQRVVEGLARVKETRPGLVMEDLGNDRSEIGSSETQVGNDLVDRIQEYAYEHEEDDFIGGQRKSVLKISRAHFMVLFALLFVVDHYFPVQDIDVRIMIGFSILLMAPLFGSKIVTSIKGLWNKHFGALANHQNA